MITEKIETIVCKHEMQRLELKESFGVECIDTACAFFIRRQGVNDG